MMEKSKASKLLAVILVLAMLITTTLPTLTTFASDTLSNSGSGSSGTDGSGGSSADSSSSSSSSSSSTDSSSSSSSSSRSSSVDSSSSSSSNVDSSSSSVDSSSSSSSSADSSSSSSGDSSSSSIDNTTQTPTLGDMVAGAPALLTDSFMVAPIANTPLPIITEGVAVTVPQQSGAYASTEYSFTPSSDALYEINGVKPSGSYVNISALDGNGKFIQGATRNEDTKETSFVLLKAGITYVIRVQNGQNVVQLSINKANTATMTATLGQPINFVAHENFYDFPIYFVAPSTGYFNLSLVGDLIQNYEYYTYDERFSSGDNVLLKQGQAYLFNVRAFSSSGVPAGGITGSFTINNYSYLQYDSSGKLSIKANENDLNMGESNKLIAFTPTLSGKHTFTANFVATSDIIYGGKVYPSSDFVCDVLDSSFVKMTSGTSSSFRAMDSSGNPVSVSDLSPINYSFVLDLVAGQTYYFTTNISNLVHNVDMNFQVIQGEVVDLPPAVKYIPYGEKMESTATSAYAVSEGYLPAGMSLTDAGELYGVPQESGTFFFRAAPQHSSPVTIDAYKNYRLVIAENTNQNVWNETNNDYKIEQYIGVPNANGDYVIQKGTQQVFVSEGEFSEFIDLWLNGRKLVENVDYTKVEGSTVITIFAQTLDRYATVGPINTIAMEFRAGGVPTGELRITAQNFIVEAPLAPEPQNSALISPLTGVYKQ